MHKAVDTECKVMKQIAKWKRENHKDEEERQARENNVKGLKWLPA